jgi:hypothetical protein
VKKLNYGPQGSPLTVRWKAGAYVPEGGASSLDRLALVAKGDKAEETFLALLRLFGEQGQTGSRRQLCTRRLRAPFEGGRSRQGPLCRRHARPAGQEDGPD